MTTWFPHISLLSLTFFFFFVSALRKILAFEDLEAKCLESRKGWIVLCLYFFQNFKSICWTMLFCVKVYLYERQSNSKSLLVLVLSQSRNAHIVRLFQAKAQEPEAPCGSPKWIAENPVLEPSWAVFRHISTKLRPGPTFWHGIGSIPKAAYPAAPKHQPLIFHLFSFAADER